MKDFIDSNERNGDRKKAGIIILTLIVIAAVAIFAIYKLPPSSTPIKLDLTLNNYTKIFKKDVIIVIGGNASNTEIKVAQAVAENLSNLTGNLPVIKTDAEITEKEKAGYNLILLGRPESNSMLREVYEKTNATIVTNEFPGAGRSMLEILRNPWNGDKALLLVVGNDESGLKAAFTAYNKSLIGVNGSVGYAEPEGNKLVQVIKLNLSARTLSEAEEKAKLYFFETSEKFVMPNVNDYAKGYEFNDYFTVVIRRFDTITREDKLLKVYRIEKVKNS